MGHKRPSMGVAEAVAANLLRCVLKRQPWRVVRGLAVRGAACVTLHLLASGCYSIEQHLGVEENTLCPPVMAYLLAIGRVCGMQEYHQFPGSTDVTCRGSWCFRGRAELKTDKSIRVSLYSYPHCQAPNDAPLGRVSPWCSHVSRKRFQRIASNARQHPGASGCPWLFQHPCTGPLRPLRQGPIQTASGARRLPP